MDDVEALGRDDLALNLIAMAPTCSLGCLGVLAHYSHHDNDDKRLMPSHDENQLAIPIEIDLGSLIRSLVRTYRDPGGFATGVAEISTIATLDGGRRSRLRRVLFILLGLEREFDRFVAFR